MGRAVRPLRLGSLVAMEEGPLVGRTRQWQACAFSTKTCEHLHEASAFGQCELRCFLDRLVGGMHSSLPAGSGPALGNGAIGWPVETLQGRMFLIK